jgi:hypothetical protein
MLPMLLSEIVSRLATRHGRQLRHGEGCFTVLCHRARAFACTEFFQSTRAEHPLARRHSDRVEGKEKPALVGEVVYIGSGAPMPEAVSSLQPDADRRTGVHS